MIIVAQEILDGVRQYCASKLPYEACGVFFGKENSGNIDIEHFKGIDNIASNHDAAFLMNPSQWTAALLQTKNSSLDLVGIFHSHPSSSAIPSREDLQTLWKHIPTHWIISFADPSKTQINAYKLLNDGEYELIPIHPSGATLLKSGTTLTDY